MKIKIIHFSSLVFSIWKLYIHVYCTPHSYRYVQDVSNNVPNEPPEPSYPGTGTGTGTGASGAGTGMGARVVGAGVSAGAGAGAGAGTGMGAGCMGAEVHVGAGAGVSACMGAGRVDGVGVDVDVGVVGVVRVVGVVGVSMEFRKDWPRVVLLK